MIIFSPQVMSYLVVGLVFRSMLHPTTGFLNNFLRGIGLDGLAKNWLTDLSLVFPTVMTVDLSLIHICSRLYRAAGRSVSGAGYV